MDAYVQRGWTHTSREDGRIRPEGMDAYVQREWTHTSREDGRIRPFVMACLTRHLQQWREIPACAGMTFWVMRDGGIRRNDVLGKKNVKHKQIMNTGIYFHIPYCKSKCAYCDFYSVTDRGREQAALSAMLHETRRRGGQFAGDGGGRQATIYFGGGTPSLLRAEDIAALAEEARRATGVSDVVEFTVEVNPDDITAEYLGGLRSAGANRLSMGVQSFFDEDLRRMQRRHTAQQAIEGVAMAKQAGFAVSIDLMYGIPSLTCERWQANLEQAFALDISHLSAYCLTLEPHTQWGKAQSMGVMTLPDEDEAAAQYILLTEMSAHYGFEHYEISNFAAQRQYAQHNTGYWQGSPYMGIGAAAHSYNGSVRTCNAPSVERYIDDIEQNRAPYYSETLTAAQKYNEIILTGLRTRWGVNEERITERAGARFAEYFVRAAQPLLRQGRLIQCGSQYTIPQKFWFVADQITVQLIWG